jgi:excisionase family DNA binding protein
MTLPLKDAAEFLGLHPETLRERAKAGKIPGAKIGKAWRFLPADLTAYFRSQCRSTVALEVRSGGSTCGTLAAEELDALLERATKKRPNESTTSLRLVSGQLRKRAGNSRTPS